MGEAMVWALLAASSLLLGALVAFAVKIPRRVLGLIMGFGAGVLISAVAYELILEAVELEVRDGIWGVYGSNVNASPGARRARPRARRRPGTAMPRTA